MWIKIDEQLISASQIESVEHTTDPAETVILHMNSGNTLTFSNPAIISVLWEWCLSNVVTEL